ncbi:O-sialoglycoprotein endopeptidase [Candidatus Kinetoplastibacterium blastocrithidii TCC012E]|uniref:N(6)-L-threonylcarbamoyladenine synthase n=2 Tax=cellular organisms TaxID=131567 RepID=S9UD68_9TRYP|nr:tRNA (adenosine(37)-N6)-threonylcarbamoyltransferase complex transferase subunit TsaD [Candidatus Kinetoplastibacterium blastocrithidii]AGF49695.1 O-sialoglycoprotein endopeptidase [Candidatus Kinetoplastibacterium blastocrithidii TCC012E]EPY26878.1 O-sialoglycoprotein endopeptidase [Strigomonas culicis]|eukprot:EPY26878.1 O-sialoglycoprotein endopeptidase [Strigomonas culicis]
MIILGFESSCDDTCVAVFSTNLGLVSNIVHTQKNTHIEYGGIVPELASRDHLSYIVQLTKKAMSDIDLDFCDINAVAYTAGPGLLGSLLVGSSFAKSIAWSLSKPSIPINHLEGHLLSPLITNQDLKFPFICLLVSGGNTMIVLVKDFCDYYVLGDTLDDAAGEAFDKIAKLIGLTPCTGLELSKLADDGDSSCFDFPRPMLRTNDLNFSFSGLKTSVMLKIKKLKSNGNFDYSTKANIAASVQDAITDILVHKVILAVKKTGINNVAISGGVSANKILRNKLIFALNPLGGNVYLPDIELCTDNAAMIAFAASYRIKSGLVDFTNIADLNHVISRWGIEDINR